MDFNVGFTEAIMAAFCNEYKLKALNKEPTCFNNYTSPSCVDLFLTNCRKKPAFQIYLNLTVLKATHEKVPPKIIKYRDYKNFVLTRFFEKLQARLTHLDMNSLNFGSLKK